MLPIPSTVKSPQLQKWDVRFSSAQMTICCAIFFLTAENASVTAACRCRFLVDSDILRHSNSFLGSKIFNSRGLLIWEEQWPVQSQWTLSGGTILTNFSFPNRENRKGSFLINPSNISIPLDRFFTYSILHLEGSTTVTYGIYDGLAGAVPDWKTLRAIINLSAST